MMGNSMSASAEGAAPGLDRFVLKERIGGGAMGEVFRAFDRERNEDVALKMLREPEPQKVYLFKREFRALAGVAHPNLVRLHELVSAGDRWFFTMELLHGVDFLTWVRRDVEAATIAAETPTTDVGPGAAAAAHTDWSRGSWDLETSTAHSGLLRRAAPISTPPAPVLRSASPLLSSDQWARLREGTRQLACGVQALHDHGSLHRDIKPSNVMVTADGRVVLLDFGIIANLSRPAATDGPNQLYGTPAYMAPEVGTRRGFDAPADWYAVGVMLYEAMAGRRPFHAPVAELLELKRRRDPPPVRDFAIAPPADLEVLCMQLLSREPERRPAGPDVLQRLGARWSAPALATSPDRGPDLALIGRDDHLAALRAAYSAAVAGEPRVVLISGASGAGKSTLVARFLSEVAAEGQAMVVPGRCYERESVPFKAVDDLIDNLCQRLAALPRAEVASLLPRRVAALARLFPVLDRIDAVRAAPHRGVEPTDPHEQRRVAFAALRDLLMRVSAQQPLVLYIDDGQWGDDDSAALLAEVFRVPYAPPALLVVTYRDTPDMGRFVEHVRDIDRGHVELHIGDLTPADARALADQILTPAGVPGHLVDVIARESGGNALFVTELARYVVSGAEAQRLVSLDDIVRSRLSELPAGARRLLQLLATAAWPVPRAIAVRAADVADEMGTIDALLAARLIHVRTGRDGDLLETFHDRIRVAVSSQLAADDVRDLHLRLADAIPDDDARLVDHRAMHLDHAGDGARAGACYRQAADAAAAKLAFGRAARMYGRAIALLAPTGGERAALFARMAEAFQNAGNGVESAAAYREAAADVDRVQSLRYRGMAGQQLLRAGDIDQGLATISEVLGEVGLRMPRSRAGAIASLLYHRLRVRLGRLRYVERNADTVSPEQLTKINVTWTASVAVGLSDTIAGAVFQARHLREALRVGEPHHVALALALEGVYRSLSSSTADTVDEVTVRARDLADRRGDWLTVAWANGAYAMTRYQAGEWRRTLQAVRGSLAAMEGRAGMWFERATVEVYQLWALHWLGNFRELGERAMSLRSQALDLGDRYSATNLSIGLPAVHWLVRGRPDEGRQAADDAMAVWSRQSYHLQHHWHAYAIAHVDLYQGRPRPALERLRRAWKDAGKALLRTVRMVRFELLFAWGRAAMMTAMEPGAADQRALLREVLRCARGLRAEKRDDAAALAACLEAAVCMARGDLDGAIPLLTAAIDRFSQLEMGFLAEAAKRARGLLLGERGAAMVRDAEAWMLDQGIVDPAAFCRVFLPGFPG
jgi:serine/threonine protein kinase/tetratricopeptide (TPR) repeat protein